jgi:hypothetical protein
MGPIPLPFVDPTPLLQMVISLISESLRQSAVGFDWVLEYYFLWTGNFHGGADCLLAYARPDCAFTGNDVLRGLYRLVAAIADTFLVAIVTYSFLRNIFERSFRGQVHAEGDPASFAAGDRDGQFRPGSDAGRHRREQRRRARDLDVPARPRPNGFEPLGALDCTPAL